MSHKLKLEENAVSSILSYFQLNNFLVFKGIFVQPMLKCNIGYPKQFSYSNLNVVFLPYSFYTALTEIMCHFL